MNREPYEELSLIYQGLLRYETRLCNVVPVGESALDRIRMARMDMSLCVQHAAEALDAELDHLDKVDAIGGE